MPLLKSTSTTIYSPAQTYVYSCTCVLVYVSIYSLSLSLSLFAIDAFLRRSFGFVGYVSNQTKTTHTTHFFLTTTTAKKSEVSCFDHIYIRKEIDRNKSSLLTNFISFKSNTRIRFDFEVDRERERRLCVRLLR